MIAKKKPVKKAKPAPKSVKISGASKKPIKAKECKVGFEIDFKYFSQTLKEAFNCDIIRLYKMIVQEGHKRNLALK